MIDNDIAIFGLLAAVLAAVFYTRGLGGGWQKFYTFVPIVLVCYLVPSLMATFGLIDMSDSSLWPIARDAFLPAALFLMCLGIDLGGILRLGPRALIMFFTATIGIVIGGPLALVQNGDFITLDVAARTINLDISEDELAKRRAAGVSRTVARGNATGLKGGQRRVVEASLGDLPELQPSSDLDHRLAAVN